MFDVFEIIQADILLIADILLQLVKYPRLLSRKTSYEVYVIQLKCLGNTRSLSIVVQDWVRLSTSVQKELILFDGTGWH